MQRIKLHNILTSNEQKKLLNFQPSAEFLLQAPFELLTVSNLEELYVYIGEKERSVFIANMYDRYLAKKEEFFNNQVLTKQAKRIQDKLKRPRL